MIRAYWAEPNEKEEIIEFIDYVFSKAHRPHDFASLLPKLYGPKGDGAGSHFVIREQGKIAATVLCYPVMMHVGGRQLLTLGVGSVSTHPAARGKGYMKRIMAAVDERAAEMGAAFAVLGGQRQRYQYFGYDCGGYQLTARLEPVNVRHALGGLDAAAYAIVPMTQEHVPQAMALLARQACCCARSEEAYLDILRSWYNEPVAVMKDGQPVGFGALRQNPDCCCVAELLLEDEADFPCVMKAMSQKYGVLELIAAPWQRERAKWLSSVCEDYCVKPNCMYKLYQPDAVREALAGLDGFMNGFVTECGALYVAPPDCV